MKNKFEPIAIIGISTLYPGSQNIREFWRDIINGKDRISDIPQSHWLIDDYYDADPTSTKDKTYCKRGGFLSDVDFDPLEFGIPPNVIPAVDTSQLLSLLVAKNVLIDALGENFQEQDLSKVSIILGTSALEALTSASARVQQPVWKNALEQANIPKVKIAEIIENISASYTPWQENSFPGLLSNVVAGRIANRFNLGGTNCITDAACAGSFAALQMSINELQMGICDIAITGGVDTLNDIVMYMCFSKTKALSMSGDCRPFSNKADGTVLGEGLAMFALKRLVDAEKNNDQIYAVIKGIGTSSDGRSKSIYAPLAQGQARALERAYEQAGYAINTVEMIEAHGTGTKAGDLAEFQGLQLAFKNSGETRKNICALGSIKSQIGHTKSAAGAAGLFKAIMSLHHKVLPPTIKVEAPSPELDIENSALYLNTILRPWIKNTNHPRRAGVSAFGFGGSNFHVALEEYSNEKNKTSRLRCMPTELILYTANTSDELLKNLDNTIKANQAINLIELARSSQENFNAEHKVRLGIIASDNENVMLKLQYAMQLIAEDPNKLLWVQQGIYYSAEKMLGKIAFIFPDESSQYVNMTADLSMNFSDILLEWQNSSKKIANNTISQMVFPTPTFSEKKQKQNASLLQSKDSAKCASEVSNSIYLKLMKSLNIKADVMIEFEAEGFNENIETAYQNGARTFIEVGANNILTKRILDVLENHNDYVVINLDRKEEHGITELWHALAKCIVVGINPEFSYLWREYQKTKDVNKNISKHSIKINGANFAKPYPSKMSKISNNKNTIEETKPQINHTQARETTMSNDNNIYLIQMQQELQKQLIDAHNTYQKMMSESHIAFLNAMTNLSNQANANNNVVNVPTMNIPVRRNDSQVSVPQMQPKVETKTVPVAPSHTAISVPHVAVTPVMPKPLIQTAESVSPTSLIKTINESSHDLEKLLLDIVVEKTGYPLEMLNMEMSIEADLGIDSIKRVEILATLSEKAPNLPEISPNELTNLQSLGDIVSYMKKKS